jgi:hypothetical protein
MSYNKSSVLINRSDIIAKSFTTYANETVPAANSVLNLFGINESDPTTNHLSLTEKGALLANVADFLHIIGKEIASRGTEQALQEAGYEDIDAALADLPVRFVGQTLATLTKNYTIAKGVFTLLDSLIGDAELRLILQKMVSIKCAIEESAGNVAEV